MAALSIAVSNVVGMRANKQMVRVNAWWIIAFVADDQPIRDWSDKRLIRKSMRLINLSISA